MSVTTNAYAKPDIAQLMEFAIRAAQCCAKAISYFSEPTMLGCKANATDLISAADSAGEAAIRTLIKNERPDDGFLGEEGSNQLSNNGLRWVFDPLDGTVNYLYKIPHWAISIACEKFENDNWQPIVGVVYDAMRGETFTAIQGGGAYLNGHKIFVNNPAELANSLIATGFSYNTQSRIVQAQVLATLLPQVRDIRSSGSSALDLCWVAAGRWDGFYENDLYRWDWSAASLIVEEARGIISALGTGVIAAAPALHNILCKLIIQK